MVHSEGHWRLKPALNCCGRAEQKGVQSDRQQSAGDDQALALGWKQTKRNTELSEDKEELPKQRSNVACSPALAILP